MPAPAPATDMVAMPGMAGMMPPEATEAPVDLGTAQLGGNIPPEMLAALAAQQAQSGQLPA